MPPLSVYLGASLDKGAERRGEGHVLLRRALANWHDRFAKDVPVCYFISSDTAFRTGSAGTPASRSAASFCVRSTSSGSSTPLP